MAFYLSPKKRKQIKGKAKQSFGGKGRNINLQRDLETLAKTYKEEGIAAAIDLGSKLIERWAQKSPRGVVPHQLHYNMGFLALNEGYLGFAQDCFEKCLKTHTSHHSSLIGIADCQFRQGDFEESLKNIMRAINIKPLLQYKFLMLNGLYSTKQFGAVLAQSRDEIPEILKTRNPSDRKIHTLALNMAACPQEKWEGIFRVYNKNNQFADPERVFKRIRKVLTQLRDIHDPMANLGKEPADDLEAQLLSRDRKISNRARRMIRAFGGSKVWVDMHSRIAANYNVANAVGTFGLTHASPHSEAPPHLRGWPSRPREIRSPTAPK